MTSYAGSCHCGDVKFEINTIIDRITECNCSICSQKGILHHRVTPDRFKLLSDASQLGTYQFGTMVAKHHFCKRCGTHLFTRPRAAPEMYTVNVRCLDNFDLRDVQEVAAFNGRNWEDEVGKLSS